MITLESYLGKKKKLDMCFKITKFLFFLVHLAFSFTLSIFVIFFCSVFWLVVVFVCVANSICVVVMGNVFYCPLCKNYTTEK
jgi:hypothetical protein